MSVTQHGNARASAKPSCSAVAGVLSGHSGVPDSATGSIFLIDGPHYQQTHITAVAKLGAGCDNAGIVFGYIDRLNFWVRVWSKASQTIRLYEVSNGTWTQRTTSATTITAGTQFTMDTSDARSGFAAFYAATVPAGQVGLWVSHGADNEFDDFKCRDIAGPFEADGKWFSDKGEAEADRGGRAKIDNANDNVMKSNASNTGEAYNVCIPRRGFRGEKYVATFKFKWNAASTPGFLVRWLNNGDWLAVAVKASDSKAYVYRRVSDGTLATPAGPSSALSLTSGTWYNAKVLVDDDAGNSALQRLRFWVDTDGDGDYSDETTLIDSNIVDDNWSAGYAEKPGTEKPGTEKPGTRNQGQSPISHVYRSIATLRPPPFTPRATPESPPTSPPEAALQSAAPPPSHPQTPPD